VAELGRQPWVIEGVLPTAVAVSNLGAGTVLLTLVIYTLLYTVLLIIEWKLLFKAIRKGPELRPETIADARRRGHMGGTVPVGAE